MESPYFDRKSLTFGARRLARGIVLTARFNAPRLTTGRPGQYLANITIDPTTRGVIGVRFEYSRDGSKYLASHGGKTDQLRKFAYEICNIFLASPAWKELKDREPDPYYIVDQQGKVTVRVRTEIRPEHFGGQDIDREG